MPFSYSRIVRFRDTDAAGVVYFAAILSMCHEAYEASLAAAGIDLKQFFRGAEGYALPIVHTSADFHRPLLCGDAIAIVLTADLLNEGKFETRYQLFAKAGENQDRLLASAIAIHVCIDSRQRVKRALPDTIHRWLQLVQQESNPSA